MMLRIANHDHQPLNPKQSNQSGDDYMQHIMLPSIANNDAHAKWYLDYVAWLRHPNVLLACENDYVIVNLH